MTVLDVLVYVALIGWVLARRVRGQPLRAPRQLFVLPVVLIVLGYGDVTRGVTKPVDVTVAAIGAIVSLALGLLRGRADTLSVREGVAFMQWSGRSLALFGITIATKLVLDLAGIAAGGTAAAAGKSLVLTFGLTLLGEAVVLWLRSGGAATLAARTRTPGGE